MPSYKTGPVLGQYIVRAFSSCTSMTCQRSTVSLFADDTTAYIAIESDNDIQALQRDLNSLADWKQKWQMEFHQENFKSLE